MPNKSLVPDEIIEALIERYRYDPLGWVRAVYPWGKHYGLQPPHNHKPEEWQENFLRLLGRELQGQQQRGETEPIKIAIASGKGIGKTATFAWLVHWFTSCFAHSQIRATANTGEQLRNALWKELANWKERAMNGHHFEWLARKYVRKGHEKTWIADAVTWNIYKPEAFQGVHNQVGTLYIFDESSGIPEIIKKMAEETLTDAGAVRILLAFSNPTQNSGWFKECFDDNSGWLTANIDGRTVSRTDKKWYQNQIDTFGEDSDEVRRAVTGKFPRFDSLQLIPEEKIEEAAKRTVNIESCKGFAKILGIDVGREGDDPSASIRRQGKKAWNLRSLYGVTDGFEVGKWLSPEIDEFDPDIIVVDVVGPGASVYDYLKNIKGLTNLVAAYGQATAYDYSDLYKNQRAYAYFKLLEWFDKEADIPNDPKLKKHLRAIQHTYEKTGLQKRKILGKREIKKILSGESPDFADALMYTHWEEPEVKTERELFMEEFATQRGKSSGSRVVDFISDLDKNKINGSLARLNIW